MRLVVHAAGCTCGWLYINPQPPTLTFLLTQSPTPSLLVTQAPGDRPTVRQLLQHPFVSSAAHPPLDWPIRVADFCNQPRVVERTATNATAAAGPQSTLPKWNFPGTVVGTVKAATGTVRAADVSSIRADSTSVRVDASMMRGDKTRHVVGHTVAVHPRNGTVLDDTIGSTAGSTTGGSVGARGVVDSALDGQHGTFREVPRARPPGGGGASGGVNEGYGTVTSSYRKEVGHAGGGLVNGDGPHGTVCVVEPCCFA